MPANFSDKDLKNLDRYADLQAAASSYDEILKQPIPHVSRVGIYFVSLLLIGTFILLYFSKVNIIVLTRGVVRPVGETFQIEAHEGGVVTQMLAKVGDRLKEGDPIIKLDFSQKTLELTQLHNDLDLLEQDLEEQQATKAVVDAMMQDLESFLKSDEGKEL